MSVYKDDVEQDVEQDVERGDVVTPRNNPERHLLVTQISNAKDKALCAWISSGGDPKEQWLPVKGIDIAKKRRE